MTKLNTELSMYLSKDDINNRLKENFMQKSYNSQRTRIFILVLNQIVENHLKEDIYNATIPLHVLRNRLH